MLYSKNVVRERLAQKWIKIGWYIVYVTKTSGGKILRTYKWTKKVHVYVFLVQFEKNISSTRYSQ